MNILNENEAIVINSLENWEKVAEILHENLYVMDVGLLVKKLLINEYRIPFYIRCKGNKVLASGTDLQVLKAYYVKTIQDTEFIAKHSKNTDMDDVRPPKQDKNMKIVVKKENGLLEVGKEYVFEFLNGYYKLYFTDNTARIAIEIHSKVFNDWLTNGYIEKVKEVLYRFEDISGFVVTTEPFCCEKIHTSNQKQLDQMQAFAKLTHVRAKILKDHGYSEDWQSEGKSYVVYARYTDDFRVTELDTCNYGLEIDFPTRELAELALQHNQELFKTYLGV